LQLSWGQVLSHGDFEVYYEVLKKLFARFGYIIHHAYSKDDVDLDDPQYITPIPSSDEKEVFIATRKYIRQMICIFLSLFRYVFLLLLLYKTNLLSLSEGQSISYRQLKSSLKYLKKLKV
jgi:hypothetical protein